MLISNSNNQIIQSFYIRTYVRVSRIIEIFVMGQ